MESQTKARSFVENVVVIAILLVLVQTFLEDFAVIREWSWDIRKILLVTGFCFDLFFTIEFFTRLFYAIIDNKVGDYLFHRRGWIDFLASIPLLLLNSGPAALALVIGGSSAFGIGGFLNVLKVVKAIRIARILRLLRVLKIFKQIKYADSKMAQRHIAMITGITITVFVFIIFFVTVLSPVLGLPTVDKAFRNDFNRTFTMLNENVDNERWRSALSVAENSEELLIYRVGGELLFTRYDNDFYQTMFGPKDYQYYTVDEYEVFFDLRTIHRHQSKDNLLYFIVIVVLVVFYLIYYSPHFAITVTDPIHVMKRGMEEPSYNLEVKIPELYKNDDIFELAERYNQVFLPMKDRDTAEESGGSSGGLPDLSMDDLQDLFDDEKE